MTKTRTRTRIVYRDRPAPNWFNLDTIRRVKDGLWSFGAILTVLWFVAGPFVNAQAGDYLKGQLIEIGMDPATVQTLNKNLQDLQETVKERVIAVEKLSDEVNEMKGDIGKVLILLQTQQQPLPAPIAEPVK